MSYHSASLAVPGTGHIAKKGNRYYVVIDESPDPATGKPRYRWHAAGASRGDAEKLLAEIVRRIHDGDYRAPDKITVDDYLLHRWLPSKRTRVKPSTANSYERNIQLHIIPNILGPRNTSMPLRDWRWRRSVRQM